MTLRSYFGNQNSTLGSVVPLAMFVYAAELDVLEIFRFRKPRASYLMIVRKVLLNCAKGYNFPRYVARSKLCCSCQFFLLRWLCQPPLTPDQRRSEQWASVIMSSDWTVNRINKPILGDASRMVETHISVSFTFQQTGFCYLCIKHAENWTTTFFFAETSPTQTPMTKWNLVPWHLAILWIMSPWAYHLSQ